MIRIPERVKLFRSKIIFRKTISIQQPLLKWIKVSRCCYRILTITKIFSVLKAYNRSKCRQLFKILMEVWIDNQRLSKVKETNSLAKPANEWLAERESLERKNANRVNSQIRSKIKQHPSQQKQLKDLKTAVKVQEKQKVIRIKESKTQKLLRRKLMQRNSILSMVKVKLNRKLNSPKFRF